MNRERLKDYAYFTVVGLGLIAFAFLFLRYLFVPILPFIIAWGVAFVLRSPSIFISKKLKLNRKFVAVSLAVLSVALGIGALTALSVFGLHKLWEFLSDFVSGNSISEMLAGISDPVGAFFGEGVEINAQVGAAIKEALNKLISWLVELVSTAVRSVPRFLFFLLVTVISSVYFSMDLERINNAVKSLLPEKFSSKLVRIKNRFFSVGIKYIRSYLILMLITFGVMLIGFLILRVKNAFLIAALVAFLDLLPIIGVGTLLVPWSIYQMIFGSLWVGIGIAILLVLHEIIRQFVEPKIIGKSLGIHPIISLMLLYVGYSVFGISGLILLPLIGAMLGIVLKKKDSSEVS